MVAKYHFSTKLHWSHFGSPKVSNGNRNSFFVLLFSAIFNLNGSFWFISQHFLEFKSKIPRWVEYCWLSCGRPPLALRKFETATETLFSFFLFPAIFGLNGRWQREQRLKSRWRTFCVLRCYFACFPPLEPILLRVESHMVIYHVHKPVLLQKCPLVQICYEP